MVVNNRGDLSNGLPPDEQLPDGDSELRPKHDRDRATELELVDAALLGDMQAFSNLLEHYRSDLYGFCLRRLDDASLAEDVVQEVFIKALTNLPIFDRSKRVWPWLATIASRLCIDLQRRRSFIHYSGNIGTSVDTGKNGYIESVLDSVVASEERAELWKSLDILPMRQRRAFVLYEVDGLSCADIAAAEGISVGAVKLLLFRARKKMRTAGQSRPLPAIAPPFAWLGWKLQRIEERVRPLLAVYGEGFSTACVQALCLSTVILIVVATNPSRATAQHDSMTVQPATALQTMQSQSLQTAFPNVAVSSEAPVDPELSVAEAAGSLADDVINPHHDATPENTLFTSIAASPNYENDHTVLASGWYRPSDGIGGGSVLFVSRDGGGSWKPLPSRLLSGYAVALPPNYPQDQRIFAIGDLGLQQSDDGGAIFKAVSPMSGWDMAGFNLAISPAFGKGDSRILFGYRNLFEYDAVMGITRPTSMAIPLSATGIYHHIAFSPSYESDSTVFISGSFEDNLVARKNILYRCKRSVCDGIQLPFRGLTLRLSPRFDQDSLAYAYSYSASSLFESSDGAQTFREIRLPLPGPGSMRGVAILWNASPEPTIFASVGWLPPPGVFRSFDGGRSWENTRVDVPGFDYGAEKLTATPTGRLLASGTEFGIACSDDGGQTWNPRCSPE